MKTPTLIALTASLCLLSACQPQQKSVAHLRDLGDHYLGVQRYDEAAANYGEYVERKPGEPDVRTNYGRALIGAGQYEKAAEQLQIAYAQRPDDEGTLDALADAMMKAHQQDALFRLLKTNSTDRGRIDDHLRLGRYSLQMGDTDTASLAYTTAARIDKGQTLGPQLGLVDYYMAIGDLPNAERRLRMAYYIAPLSPEVNARISKLHPVVGPTFATIPEERVQ
jgi:tetratricopeptide (TPR) repeat protein